MYCASLLHRLNYSPHSNCPVKSIQANSSCATTSEVVGACPLQLFEYNIRVPMLFPPTFRGLHQELYYTIKVRMNQNM